MSPLRGRLEAVLAVGPEHAKDVLADLAAMTAGWKCEQRLWLLRRFTACAEAGAPLPAALLLAVGAGLDD